MIFDANAWRTMVPLLTWALVSFRAWLRHSLRRLTRLRQSRRDVAFLQTLEERMLRDIGLTRSDVQHAASVWFWRDPGPILASRAGPRGDVRRPIRARREAAGMDAPSIVPAVPRGPDREARIPARSGSRPERGG